MDRFPIFRDSADGTPELVGWHMAQKVIRAFKTPIRRFAVGATVSRFDLDGPMALEDWVAGGFIESDEPVRNVVPVQVDPDSLVYEHSDEAATSAASASENPDETPQA